MAISIKADPINRDIALMLDQSFSPEAQSAAFAEFAAEQIEQAKQTDARILGRIPRTTIAVDGRDGAPLQSVRPDGVIVAEFELVTEVLAWIADQLVLHSPVGSGGDKHPGLYKQSHVLFADGQEIQVSGDIPPADVYVFLNTVPYSPKIEHGSSSQAPDGVYQAVATLAKRRFGNIAYIEFNYLSTIDAGKYRRLGSGGRDKRTGRFMAGAGAASDRAYNTTRQPAIIVKLGGR